MSELSLSEACTIKMSSEELPVEIIRRCNRDVGHQERKEHREIQLNSKRGILGEIQCSRKRLITPEEVKTLAERLKQRGHFTIQDFSILNQALIQTQENIVAFFKVTGAVHSLVRELTGQNASLQLAAANCCCNLALGNEKSCLQLTKAAAPYLISHLDGLNNHLLDICVWTLGNLAGSHVKSWTILHTQGLLPKLLHLVTSSNKDVVHSAVYALTHYVRIGLNAGNLDSTSLRSISTNVHSLLESEPSVSWLNYLLSCSLECDDVLLCNAVVNRTVCVLQRKIDCDNVNEKISELTALVRILGNLSAGEAAGMLLSTESSVVKILPVLLTSSYVHVQHETLWLIGNLINHSSVEVQLLVKTWNLEDCLEPILSNVIHKIL